MEFITFLENTNQPNITLIVILSIIVAILCGIGFFIFYRLYIFPRKIRKQIGLMNRRYEYLHGLLEGENSQHVKRLERISRTNLLYAEKHERFSLKLKELLVKYDNNVQSSLNELKDFIIDKNYKGANAYLSDAAAVLNDFEERVNSFNREISDVIKPEEDAKKSILEVQEAYRSCKAKFNEFGEEVRILNDSFNKVFELIERKFKEYESYVESANYDDAALLLPNIKGMIKELQGILEVVPSLCVSLIDILPGKLKSLKRTYQNLLNENYFLNHLNIVSFIDSSNQTISKLIESVRLFKVAGVQSNIDLINRSIDSLNEEFEKEKAAKAHFLEKNTAVYNFVNVLEKRFIKLNNTLPEIQKVYVVDDEYVEKMSVIQKEIDSASGMKRTLDIFTHNYSLQPYTVIDEKMQELEELSKEIDAHLNEFQNYVDSLKKDSQAAFSTLFSIFNKTKKCEFFVREASIDEFTKRYASQLHNGLVMIDSIFKSLKVLPINVELNNDNIRKLKNYEENVLTKIEQEYSKLQLADAAILITNRNRANFSAVETLLDQAEEYYFNAQFDEAYEKACDAERIAKSGDVTTK